MSKNPMMLAYIALLLILVNAFGGLLFAVYSGVELNMGAVSPRLLLVGFLCAMVYMEKNWARLTVGILASIAAIGSLATVALHFYTNSPGMPHPSLFIQIVVFLVSAVLLLVPKSVRQYFRDIQKQSSGNHITKP